MTRTVEAADDGARDDQALGLAHLIRRGQQHQNCVAVGDAHRVEVAQHIGASNAAHVIGIVDQRKEKLKGYVNIEDVSQLSSVHLWSRS